MPQLEGHNAPSGPHSPSSQQSVAAASAVRRVGQVARHLTPQPATASTSAPMAKERVCILGSGNWGSAIARIVGQNTQNSSLFEETVNMWVYEETINGRKLTEIINRTHENIRYLPNIKLPENIVAVPEVLQAVEGATILVFVVPHQFLKGILSQLKGKLAPNAKAISLIKGIDTTKGLQLISDIIRDSLDIDVSVLMGANVADEVAMEKFCETTIGSSDPVNGELFRKLFHRDYFRVNVVQDVAGPELCGALKNVVALGAGFVDGLELGGNTKAAIMRIGLMEMKKFAETFYGGIKQQTFLESCGVGDLITTCYNGRNHRVSVVFVKTGKSYEQLEAEMLRGQKLQGVGTAQEVHHFLSERGKLDDFPLFTTIYRIAFEGLPPADLLKNI